MITKISGYENKVVLALLFIILLAKVFVWSLSIPYNAAPDESAHFTTPLFIYNNNRLPVFGKDMDGTFDFTLFPVQSIRPTYSSMPYIGYIISALFMKIFDFLGILYITFIARLTSIISYAVFVIFAWLLAKKMFRGDTMLSFLFTWVIVNIPQVTFIASYTNNDMISLAFGTMAIYSWWLIFNPNNRQQMPNPLFWGVVLGLLAFAKTNYYILIPLSFIVYYVGLRRYTSDNGIIIKWFLKIGVISFVIAGWNLIRNFYYYHDFLGVDTFVELDKKLLVPPLSTKMNFFHYFFVYLPKSNWWKITFASSIARFGWMTLGIPGRLLSSIIVIFIISIISFVYLVYVKFKDACSSEYFLLYIFMIVLIPISISLMLWFSYTVDYQPQGRHGFASLITWTAIFVTGMYYMFKSVKLRKTVFLILCIGVFVLNIYCLFGIVRPHYKNYPALRVNKSKFWDYTFYKWQPEKIKIKDKSIEIKIKGKSIEIK